MKTWIAATLVLATASVCSCDSLTELDAEDIGSFELIWTPNLEVATPGQIEEAIFSVKSQNGAPLEGLRVSVVYQSKVGDPNPGFAFGPTGEGPFSDSATIFTDADGEAQFFVRFPQSDPGLIQNFEDFWFKGTLPDLGGLFDFRPPNAEIHLTIVPHLYTPVYLGDFFPISINNRSQVLGHEIAGETMTVVVVDPDGTIYRMPSLGEEATASSFSDSAEVVGATASGSAFRWKPGTTPEIILESEDIYVENGHHRHPVFRNVWISSNGLILTDTLLWRDGIPEPLPSTIMCWYGILECNLNWQMVNSAGDVVGAGATSPTSDNQIVAAFWDGQSVQHIWDNGQYGGVTVIDFSDAGEVIVSGHADYTDRGAILRSAYRELRSGKATLPTWEPCNSQYGCRYSYGKVNSRGTIVYGPPGVWRGGEVSLPSLLEAEGYTVSKDWETLDFDINDLEEIVAYLTIDGQEGAYLLRPTGGYPPG